MTEDTSSARDGTGAPGDFDAHPTTVLVVEDDTDLRRTIVAWLEESRKFAVLSARDGQEARSWLDRDDLRIDVALLDLVLPDASGSQLALDHILFHPDVETIYMSGHLPDDPVLAATVNDSTTAFLRKPFTLEELDRAIDRALSRPS